MYRLTLTNAEMAKYRRMYIPYIFLLPRLTNLIFPLKISADFNIIIIIFLI